MTNCTVKSNNAVGVGPGVAGGNGGNGGGICIIASGRLYLDAATVAQTTGNTASTAYDNIDGSYTLS